MRGLKRTALASAGATVAFVAGSALAEGPPQSASPFGLPSGLDWKFNLDATFGTFGFNDSLYSNPKPEEPSGDLSDTWLEGSVKPALTGTYTTKSSAQFYGKLSAVGERTFSAPPPLVGGEASSFDFEDLAIGWRSGTSLGKSEDLLDFTIGRAPYQLGHGMLLYDGSAEGGSRGGYWTNARTAFQVAAIGRFKPGNHTFEAFYLERDDLPEAGSGTEVSGLNYEYRIGEDTTLAATYMSLNANPIEAPQRITA